MFSRSHEKSCEASYVLYEVNDIECMYVYRPIHWLLGGTWNLHVVKCLFVAVFSMFLSTFAFINLSTDRFQTHTCVSPSTMWLIWCLWAALRLQWYYFRNGLRRCQLLVTLMIFTLLHTYAILLNNPVIFPTVFLKGTRRVLAAFLLLVQLTRLKIVCFF